LNAGLARAEISAPETSWGDRKAADRRQSLRTRVAMHQLIRERLRVIGVDPALAESLRLGDEAAAELAAIADTPELERADEAILRANCSNSDDGAHHVREEIKRMAELYRSGQHRVDFANASAFELLTFYVAGEIEDRNKMSGSADETSDGAQPDAAIRRAPNLTVCPSRA
jgi:formate-dependent nitrite reductase cytochrome c552 subunit